MAQETNNQIPANILRMADMFAEGGPMTKREAHEFIKSIQEFVLKLDKRQEAEIQILRQAVNQIMNRLDMKHTNLTEDLRKQVDSLFVGEKMSKMEKKHAEMMKMVDMKVKSLRHGRDGMRGERGLMGLPGPEGKMPELDMNIINKSIQEEVKKVMGNLRFGRISGGTPHNLLQTIDVSSQINGTARTFTGLPTARFYPMILSSQAPFVLLPSTHYTIGNRSITIGNNLEAPQSGTGQFLYVVYIK